MAAQEAQIAKAEEDVRVALAHLKALRTLQIVDASKHPLATTTPGLSCLNFLLEGAAGCVDPTLHAAQNCRVRFLPPPKKPVSTSPPLPPWLEALVKLLDAACGKLTCGMCKLLPPIETSGSVRKSTTVSNQHDVLPSLTGCLIGEADIDLELMAKGVRPMILALEALGPWTFIAVREMHSNLGKIESSAAVAGMNAAGEPRLLLPMLDKEKSTGVHLPGGLVAVESAAEGCLWLYRFLKLWREMWAEPRPPTFKEAIDLAYQKSICAYHSWLVQVRLSSSASLPCRRLPVSSPAAPIQRIDRPDAAADRPCPIRAGAQNTFNVAISAVPSWIEARDALDNLDAAGEEGLLLSISALDPVLARFEAALKERDLWDQRQI